MFPRSFPGLSEASFKVAFEPEFTQKMRFLVELGFASREKRVGEASPREMLLALAARTDRASGGAPDDCDALRVDVSGRKAGKPGGARGRDDRPAAPWLEHRRRARSTPACRCRSPGSCWPTERSATPGVLCPETAVPPELFFEMLARRGMRGTLELRGRGTRVSIASVNPATGRPF